MARLSHGSKSSSLVPAWADESKPGPVAQDSQAPLWTLPLNGETALTNEARVNTATTGQQFDAAAAALSGGGYVITWDDDATSDVFGQLFDSAGNKLASQFQVDITTSAGTQFFPSVGALADGGFVVAWQSGTLGNADINAQRFDATGAPVGAEIHATAAANEQLNARVTGLDGGGFVISWDTITGGQYQDVSAQLYNASGTAVGSTFTLNAVTDDQQGLSTTAPLDGGGFVAIFQSITPAGSSNAEIMGQRFDSTGAMVGSEFQVNVSTANSQFGNDVARLASGGFVVTWTDPNAGNAGGHIYARLYDSSGGSLSGEILVENAASAGLGGTSVTALSDGGFAVDWVEGNGSTSTLFARAFDSSGTAATDVFAVSQTSNDFRVSTQDSAINLINGTTIFAWDGPTTSTDQDIYARNFQISSSGSLDGDDSDNVIHGTSGNDTIHGFGGNDFLDGGAGDDVLDGGTGRDVLAGRDGNDTLIGGADVANELIGGDGNDIYVVQNAGDTVVEQFSGGNDTVRTALASYSLASVDNVENLTGTSNTGQSLVGNSLSNVITGGTGNDEMQGGLGNDTYVVLNAGDTIVEQAGGGTDTVQTSLSAYTLTAANVENLTGTSNAGQSLVGNSLDNVITGGTGNDEMQGGAGNDTYVVLNAGDTIIEQPGGGTDTVQTALSLYALNAANVENLTYIGGGNFTAVGSAGDNVITGGAGSDTLDGGLGADTLIGGAGADIYLFDTAPGGGNVDTIQGFISGSDRIFLDHGIFGALATGALPAGAFVLGTAAQDADDRILYDQATGNIFYDADGNGAGAAVQFATLQGHPTLIASDFVVI